MTISDSTSKKDDVNDGQERSVVSVLTESDATVSTVTKVRKVLAESWDILTGKEFDQSTHLQDDEMLFIGNGSDIGPMIVEAPSTDVNDSTNAVDETIESAGFFGPKIDFLQDDPSTMTYARRIALSLASSKWYNPNHEHHVEQLAAMTNRQVQMHQLQELRPPKITKKEIPSLAKAWAYFDHFSLPRFLLNADGSWNRHDLKRAEPGECNSATKLYHPLCTALSQMGDFGLGIGLYFSTLRALVILTFLSGCLNIPNFIYYSSDAYSDGQLDVSAPIRGSAICTRERWVPCENCVEADFTPDRFAYNYTQVFSTTDFAIIPSNLTFTLRNDCEGATFQQGMINFGTLLFIVVGIMVINWYQKKAEVAFDEDEQTAQDYSIRIQNPPDDAVDPEEWRNFFRVTFQAHATVVTIALDNDPLIRALRERRECLRKIELKLEPGTSLDVLVLAKIAAEVETKRGFFGRLLAKVVPGVPEFFGTMAALEAKIKGWAQLDYRCSNVFCTFETEAEQRRVLSALSMGSYHVQRQAKSKLQDKRQLFRGELMLKVKESDEPNTVRWADLNVKTIDKLKPLATTTFFSCLVIFLIALLINIINDASPAWTAIAIAIFNSIFPMVAKALTDLERHSSEGIKQTSLYFKIALFRWVNTAVVITIITPFTDTLKGDGGLILSIYAIFFAEIVTTNAIQLLDPAGHFQRHFLAPRANTQDAMNLAMKGSEVQLAERYTNMTKILFLALWYCSVFPGALFMCSFALFVNYLTDGFSLMRTWKRMPHLGTKISQFSRTYFFTTAIVAMAVVSAYFWSGFPYDNLCPNDDGSLDPSYYGEWILQIGNGTRKVAPLIVNSSTESYRYCLQDYFRYGNMTFPALSRWQPEGGEWMTDEQEQVVDIYGWASLAVFGLVILYFINLIILSCQKLFSTGTEHVGEDQGIKFSDVPSISAYVPQVYSNVYSYPLLACDVTGIDTELFDWTDPDRPHSYYDLTMDADELIGNNSVRDKLVFSILSHSPPPRKTVEQIDDASSSKNLTVYA